MNMEKQKLIQHVQEMAEGLAVLDMHKKLDFTGEEFARLGITKEDIDLVNDFIDENFHKADVELFILQEGFNKYLNSLLQLLKHARMAKGYAEMGKVNLEIAKEDAHLEDEVAKGEILNGKVDSENEQGSTKEA
ncbi:antitoxin endoai [Bacillus phage vB_BanS_Nate]|uniref:Antitoxin endoai n=1 Tax=Bacillus phage vB_BanS_Nate TaxID=2894788 RepID=A0AAE8YVU4_9CAUD|nr:antitoxin endoai [Bacillus phage vB_BanS_Nate]UGO50966.1 antitoxin endoai [Bacillus phage vB_BanS_Nate]